MLLAKEKSGESKLRSVDDLCAISHPVLRRLRINFLDFTRVNGRFAIPSSMLLNIGIVLSVADCVGNVIKCGIAINDRNITRAQETFAVLGMAFVMTMRGTMLALRRVRLSKFYNDIDSIFPSSAELQANMEVAKNHDYVKKRFFLLHNAITISLILFCTMPAVKLVLFYDFEAQEPIADEYHLNPSWVPFQVKETLSYYGFIYIYEVVLALTAANMVITWDAVFVVLISQLCMYYEYLAKLLAAMDVRAANDPQKVDAFFKRLHLYIYIQQYLNSLAAELNDLFNISILSSDAGIATSICFNLFLVSDAKDYLQLISYLAPCIVEVWLIYDISKWGSVLETVTSRINEVLYEQKWYDSSLRFGKYTAMWIQSTNEPIRLTAFNIFNVNMQHFQDMMMLAYQMLTFMKSKS